MEDTTIDAAEAARKKKQQYHRAYYLKNREHVIKRTGEYRKRHPEKHAENQRRRRKKNPEAFRRRARRQYAVDRVIPERRLRKLVGQAKKRAKEKSIAFQFEAHVSFIAEPPARCDCCQVALGYGPEATWQSPSIDRIDNALGYIFGNVAIICWQCNLLKNSATVEQVEMILAYMKRHLQPDTTPAISPGPDWVSRGKHFGRFPHLATRGEVF